MIDLNMHRLSGAALTPFIHACLLLIASLGLFACGSNSSQEHSQNHIPIAESDWREKLDITYARGFDISYEKGYKVLHLIQATDTTHYLLLPEGAERPNAYPEAQRINIPIKSMIALSTTHVALADFVNADSIIVALDNTQYVYDPQVRQRIEAGDITEVGASGSLNQEMVIALQADLLMVSGMPSTDLQKYNSIISSGTPVLINTEWMEQTALGKAEWVKLMAALLNQEALAKQKYESIVESYLNTAQLTAQVEERPAILSGSPFQGSWYVPGGKSYRSQLFTEAGGHWPWKDSAVVSMPIAFENIYTYGLEADYWLNPGMFNSLDELAAKDERFADFKAFREAKVYNHNLRLSANGQGNDYFESGVVNPHLILKDLTHILHPQILPEHELYYYQKLK